MKRLFAAWIASIFIMALFVSPGWAESNKPITLVFESMFPPSFGGFPQIKAFFTGLEKATGGLVKTEYNMAGVMGKPTETYLRTISGVNSVGHFLPGLMPGVFPMHSIFDFPIKVPSGEVFTRPMIGMYKKGYLDSDWKNVKVIMLAGNAPYELFTTDKRINSIEDVKNLKIRCTFNTWVEVTKYLGAAPVSLPTGEVYLAMQKGVVDGAWWVWDAVLTFKLNEVSKYAWNVAMGGAPHAIVMNKKVYNSLPQSGKDFIEQNWEALCIDFAKENDKIIAPAKEKYLVESGRELVQLSPDDSDKLAKALRPMWTKWTEDVEKRGLPAKEALAYLNKLYSDLGGSLVGYTP